MKKLIYLLSVLCLPAGLWAQDVFDDTYYVPGKRVEKQQSPRKESIKKVVVEDLDKTPDEYVVVKRKSSANSRSVDEYNRRQNATAEKRSYTYTYEDEDPDMRGEWVGGRFEGSADDYEYAKRIIRFRNPRYAISITSPLYWDVVYGPASWDWNVYTDGMYAYAFPTYTNPLWWDWRYSPHSWNWNFGWSYGWYGGDGYWGYYPIYRDYYPGYWGYRPYYYGGWYGGYWDYPYYYGGYPGYVVSRERRTIHNANRRSEYSARRYTGRVYEGADTPRRSGTENVSRRGQGSGSYGRVVNSRSEQSRIYFPSTRNRVNGTSTRTEGYSRTGTSTSRRSSATPVYGTPAPTSRSYSRSSSRSAGTSSRSYGSTSGSTRSYTPEVRSRSSYSSGSSSRSYSYGNSGQSSSRSYSGSVGGGSSSRSRR